LTKAATRQRTHAGAVIDIWRENYRIIRILPELFDDVHLLSSFLRYPVQQDQCGGLFLAPDVDAACTLWPASVPRA
jgi:hypothetical protein